MAANMLGRAFLFAAVAVMVACPVYAVDTRQTVESFPESAAVPDFIESTRQRRSYTPQVFSWNYDKVEVASKGWKADGVRRQMMPLLLKVCGFLYATVTTAVKVKAYVDDLNKVVGHFLSEHQEFLQCDSESSVNIRFGIISRCTVSSLVVESIALTSGINGAITEAYIRTRLNSTSDEFKIITDGLLQLIHEAISTELVMVGHVFKMTRKFGSVLAERYFQAPLPVKGTEKDFVKACDNLYAAVSDFFLMSRMVVEHTRNSINSEMNSKTAGLAPEFVKHFENIMERGTTPPEYADSPFPPLSYYWDMAALEDAVSILSDINIIANYTMNEVVEDHADNPFLDKAFISNVGYAAATGLDDTITHLKKDRLRAALESATDGVLMAVYAYREAGLDVPKEQGSEALADSFESFFESLELPSRLNALVDVEKLGSVSGLASVFGVPNEGTEVSYRELLDFFVPTDYDHLMVVIKQVSEPITYKLSKFDKSTGSDVPNLDYPKILKLIRRDNSNIDSSETSDVEDSKPDVAEGSEIPRVGGLSIADRIEKFIKSGGLAAPLGPSGVKFEDLLKLAIKHASVDLLMKMQDPAACKRDPQCSQAHIELFTIIGEAMGFDVHTDAAGATSVFTDLPPARGAHDKP